MGNINPLVNQLVIPDTGSASQLGVQVGGSLVATSGTGIFSDTPGQIAFACEGSEVFRYATGLGAMKLQAVAVSYADLVAAGDGDPALLGIALPVGSIVVRTFVNVTTSFAGDGDSGSSISIGLEDQDADIVAADTLDAWAEGLVEGLEDGATANMLIITTDPKQVAVTWDAGGTDTTLEAGAMTVYVQYI